MYHLPVPDESGTTDSTCGKGYFFNKLSINLRQNSQLDDYLIISK